MDNLETLNALLDMTTEAERLVSEAEKPNRLTELITKLKRKATEERTRLKHYYGRPPTTRYELCLIGILEELFFVKLPLHDSFGLDSRLARIREEIERTIIEIKAKRKIM